MSLNREAYRSKWMWALAGMLVGVGLIGALSYREHHAHAAQVSESGASCENGIGTARAHARPPARKGALPPASAIAVQQTAWIPKINDTKPTGPAPAGMTWILAGYSGWEPMTTIWRIPSHGIVSTSMATGWIKLK